MSGPTKFRIWQGGWLVPVARSLLPLLVLAVVLGSAVCSWPAGLGALPGLGTRAASAAEEEAAAEPGRERAEDEVVLEFARQTWTGDLDGMVKRGFVRVLTVYNPLFFTYDGVDQRGLAVEIMQAFEQHLRKELGKKARTLVVVISPVARDKLLPYLMEGRGDIAAANLTITPDRQELVDFSMPSYPGVSELVITGPAAPQIASLDDLVQAEIHVRPSSSYFEHLTALNAARERDGKPPIPLQEVDELLEDYDLLEMVNAGVIPAVIVDSHKAALWAQVFEEIQVHENLAIHSGGAIAWAIRKDSPQLMAAVNGFWKTARKGTLLGNVLIKRYLGGTKWIDKVLSGEGRERYEATIGFIKEYAARYGFDWLMVAAQGYQESKLDQSKRSHRGAVGIMQVLPSTAADPQINIPDIDKPDQNVHAGVKYLRFIRNRYFSAPEIDPLDRVLFSFAAYNAGPRNIAKARKTAVKLGLDPDRWFGNVEVAAGRAISREPVVYVRNIYKYYVAYKRLEKIRRAREEAGRSQD